MRGPKSLRAPALKGTAWDHLFPAQLRQLEQLFLFATAVAAATPTAVGTAAAIADAAATSTSAVATTCSDIAIHPRICFACFYPSVAAASGATESTASAAAEAAGYTAAACSSNQHQEPLHWGGSMGPSLRLMELLNNRSEPHYKV